MSSAAFAGLNVFDGLIGERILCLSALLGQFLLINNRGLQEQLKLKIFLISGKMNFRFGFYFYLFCLFCFSTGRKSFFYPLTRMSVAEQIGIPFVEHVMVNPFFILDFYF